MGLALHVQLLCDARALISDPAHWTTGSAARDVSGAHVPSCSVNATCWCALGALVRAMPAETDMGRGVLHSVSHRGFRRAERCLMTVAARLYHQSLTSVNDHCGHDAVLRVFEFAIILASLDQSA